MYGEYPHARYETRREFPNDQCFNRSQDDPEVGYGPGFGSDTGTEPQRGESSMGRACTSDEVPYVARDSPTGPWTSSYETCLQPDQRAAAVFTYYPGSSGPVASSSQMTDGLLQGPLDSRENRAFQMEHSNYKPSHATHAAQVSVDLSSPTSSLTTPDDFSSLQPVPAGPSTLAQAGSGVVCYVAGCTKTFSRSGDRDRHIRAFHHQSPVVYVCREKGCRESNLRKDKIKLHCRNKHGQTRGQERYITRPHT